MPPTPFQITMGNSQKTMVLRRSRVWRLVTVHVICMPALGRGGLRGHHKWKGWPSQGRRVTSLLLRDSECGAVGSNAQCSRFSLVAFMPRSSNFYDQGGVGERQKGRSNTLRGVQEGVSNKISEASGNTHVLRVSIAAEELVQPRNRLLSRRVLWRRPPAGEFGGASLSRIFEEGCGAVRRGQSINVDDFWEPGDAK